MGKVCILVLLFAFVAVFVPSSGKGLFKSNEKLGLTRDNLGKVGKSKLLVGAGLYALGALTPGKAGKTLKKIGTGVAAAGAGTVGAALLIKDGGNGGGHKFHPKPTHPQKQYYYKQPTYYKKPTYYSKPTYSYYKKPAVSRTYYKQPVVSKTYYKSAPAHPSTSRKGLRTTFHVKKGSRSFSQSQSFNFSY